MKDFSKLNKSELIDEVGTIRLKLKNALTNTHALVREYEKMIEDLEQIENQLENRL